MIFKSAKVSSKWKKFTVIFVFTLLISSSFAVMFGGAKTDSKQQLNEKKDQDKKIELEAEESADVSSSENLDEIVVSDGFENSSNTNHSWTFWDSQPTGGRDYWGISGKRKHNGSKSLYVAQNNDTSGQVYDNNMRADATVNKTMNILFNEATINFGIWYETDKTGTDDTLKLQVSRLGGVLGSWRTLTTYSGSSGGWIQESIDIPNRFSSSRFKIRFRFNSHPLYNNAEGVYLDDIRLTINSNRTGGNSTPIHSAKPDEGPGFYGPSGITQRSNDDIYFTNNRYLANAIGKYNQTTSSFDFYNVPTRGSLPTSIIEDSKGNLWFTEFGGNKIGKLNTTNENITQFNLNPSSKPFDIVYKNGYLYFSEWLSGKIGRLDTQTGEVKEWTLPRRWGKPPLPRGINFGPNGDLWITESGCNQVVKFNLSTHTFVEYPIPTIINTKPVDLSFAENGKLYISESRVSRLGYFDISSGMSSYEEIQFNYTWRTSHLISHKDNIWATHIGGDNITKYNTTTSMVQNWSVPTPKSQPEGIFLSNSGNILFTEWWDDNITKFDEATETFESWSLPKIYVKDLTQRKFPAGKSVNYTAFVLSKNTTEVTVDYTLPNGTSLNKSMSKPSWFSIYNKTFDVPNQEGYVQFKIWAKDNEGHTFSVSNQGRIIPKPVAKLGSDRTFDEDHIAVVDGTDSFCPNRSRIVQYKWDFGDGTENVTFGPPVITHNYSISGDYTATLTIRDIYNRKDSDTVNFTVQQGEGTKVLLLDYLKGQGPIASRKLSNKTPNMLNDSMEKGFWSGINSSSEFDIIRRPPIYNEPRVDGKEYNISDYIQDFSPKIIIISDCILNGSDRWSLNMSERLTLMNYLEKGNGLMVTGGSLYDLREKTPEASRYIGPWGHTERLHLSDASSLNEVLKYYRSSITANIGLGLFPLYEEIRHYVGKAFENMYEAAQDPLEEALYFSASTVSYSVPLLPANIPFKANFNRMEENPNITKNLDNQFSLDLENRYSKGTDRSVGNISKDTNLTSAGWQLQYPFLMAHKALNRTRTRLQSLGKIRDTMVGNLTGAFDSFNQFFDFNNTKYSIGNLSGGVSPANFGEDDLRNITENITSSLLQALKNMYNARTNRPSEIEINVNFTVGNKTVNKTVVIPIPVTLQKLFRPAKIATMSNGGMASVLKYEMNGQRYDFEEGTPLDYKNFDPINETPVSYRSTYFTFKPSLGDKNCTKLVKNSLSWLKNTSEPEHYDLIGSMEVPEDLANQTRENISESELKSAKNQSLLLKPKQNYTLYFSVKGSAKINVYWWGANKTDVILERNETSLEIDPVRYRSGSFYAATFDVDQAGNWTMKVRVDADGLKTPLMAQQVQSQEDTTEPTISISSPSEGGNVSTSSVTVEWSGSDSGSGIDHYEVQLDSGSWTDVDTSTSYTFSDLSDGSYTVNVKAFDNASNNATETVNFTVDTTHPTLSISSPSEGANISSSSVTVEWSGSDSTSGIDHYEVQLDSGGWTDVGTDTSSTFSSLLDGAYTVDVKAVDSAGNTNTDTVTFTVNTTSLPSAPQNLQATSSDEEVSLSWDVPSDNGGSSITEYKIYRGTSSDNLALLTTVTSTSYTDQDVQNNQTYYYQVTAVNSAGEGDRSMEVSATPSSGSTNGEDGEDEASEKSFLVSYWWLILAIVIGVIVAIAFLTRKKKKPPPYQQEPNEKLETPEPPPPISEEKNSQEGDEGLETDGEKPPPPPPEEE